MDNVKSLVCVNLVTRFGTNTCIYLRHELCYYMTGWDEIFGDKKHCRNTA
jgi:hypothetical protein